MENHKNKRIIEDINQLITNFNPKADESFREEIHAYSRKVFGSFMGRSANDDPASCKHKILEKVIIL